MKTRQLKILNYLLVQDDYVPAQILADMLLLKRFILILMYYEMS